MFDFSRYRNEVARAQQADDQRRLVDDTKKRAVYQAESYDEFVSLVATCHLQPVKKISCLSSPLPPRLNKGFASNVTNELYLAGTSSTQQQERLADHGNPTLMQLGSQHTVETNFRSPRAQVAFRKHWNSLHSDEQRTRWLETLPQGTLEFVFRVEIDADFLLEIVRAIWRAAWKRGGGASCLADPLFPVLDTDESGEVKARGGTTGLCANGTPVDAREDNTPGRRDTSPDSPRRVSRSAVSGKAHTPEGLLEDFSQGRQQREGQKQSGTTAFDERSGLELLLAFARLPAVHKAARFFEKEEKKELMTIMECFLNAPGADMGLDGADRLPADTETIRHAFCLTHKPSL